MSLKEYPNFGYGSIDNYNCDGLCIEEFCSNRYTHYIRVILWGVSCHLGFCKKHLDLILKQEKEVDDDC